MRAKCLGIPAQITFFSLIGAYRGYRVSHHSYRRGRCGHPPYGRTAFASLVGARRAAGPGPTPHYAHQ